MKGLLDCPCCSNMITVAGGIACVKYQLSEQLALRHDDVSALRDVPPGLCFLYDLMDLT